MKVQTGGRVTSQDIHLRVVERDKVDLRHDVVNVLD